MKLQLSGRLRSIREPENSGSHCSWVALFAPYTHRLSEVQSDYYRSAGFIDGVAHDLRTPLTGILGFAQLLATGPSPLTPGQQSSVRAIEVAGWCLLRQIETMRDLALLNAGHLQLAAVLLSLDSMLESCLAEAEAKATSSAAQRVDLQPSGASLYVCEDPGKLAQVFRMVLDHVVSIARPGSVISVRSSGLSVDRVQVAWHFEGSPQRLGGGAPLLSMTLLDLMGGRARTEFDSDGRGTFLIELNAAQPGASPAETLRVRGPNDG